jgi:hypothetical protein
MYILFSFISVNNLVPREHSTWCASDAISQSLDGNKKLTRMGDIPSYKWVISKALGDSET